MSKYNVVMKMSNSTVVTEYEPLKKKSDSYQSEQALENEFIRMLGEQGYDYLSIHDSDSLVNNLRTQLEILNDYKFSENEWTRFFNSNIANNNEGIVEKTRKIQEDHIQVLKKDDGTSKNIYFNSNPTLGTDYYMMIGNDGKDRTKGFISFNKNGDLVVKANSFYMTEPLGGANLLK